MQKQLTLSDAINSFLEKTHNLRERDLYTTVMGFNNEHCKGIDAVKDKIFIKDLTYGKKEAEEHLERAMADVMIHSTVKKESIYEVFRKFFLHLRKEPYFCTLEIEDYIKRPIKDMKERQIDILKELQGKGKTISELESIYYLNRKTIKIDIDELARGIEFLNQTIKVECDEVRVGEKTEDSLVYSSSVHPVFLPLNLTEAYALTAVLKKISRDTPYREILGELSDWIYSQISQYGKDIIKRTIDAQGEDIYFSSREFKYETEHSQIERAREYRYVHYERRMVPVRVTYLDDNGEAAAVVGLLRTTYKDDIKVLMDDGKSILIPMKNITDVTDVNTK